MSDTVPPFWTRPGVKPPVTGSGTGTGTSDAPRTSLQPTTSTNTTSLMATPSTRSNSGQMPVCGSSRFQPPLRSQSQQTPLHSHLLLSPGYTLADLVLRVFFALYTLILAVRSSNYDVIGPHADALWHLSMLTFAATATLFTTAILPAPLSLSPSLAYLTKLVQYIHDDPERVDGCWVVGVYCWSLWRERDSPHSGRAAVEQATTTLQVRIKMQPNSVLYGKTPVRKDVASSAEANDKDKDGDSKDKFKSKAKLDQGEEEDKEEEEFTSRAQDMTLMVTDVDRVAEDYRHSLPLPPFGPSSLYGLLITLIALPSNHIAGKIVVGCQEGLMKRQDKRVGLMDEVLGGIRMVKFMGWERKSHPGDARCFLALYSFFSELKYAPNALFINILQSPVSLRRIETYLDSAEIAPVPKEPVLDPAMQGATVTWAQDRATSSSTSPRATTPAASTSGSPTPTAGAPTPTTPLPRHRARGISSTSRMSRWLRQSHCLESILFAKIRFHNTVSPGRVLNRFGQDFEGIDSNMSDNFGRSIMYGLSAVTTFITISVIGGPVSESLMCFLLPAQHLRGILTCVDTSPNGFLFGSTWSHAEYIIAIAAFVAV
ncbi:hypothetical protein FIBSPDRAFT_888399 [Athelia psychrophila]|uniref:ABC transmembrane type-1 domain-containing protein n=1 Tax=Athelia psychrophila TaxID=1759441 RepID=A0A166NEW6_9AGAM|nr:hypothetical protein FIBSPDRAFT_888399 [Fibularhizoctonia sp. CBS 109695]